MKSNISSLANFPLNYSEIEELLMHLIRHLEYEAKAADYLTPTELLKVIEDLTEVCHAMELIRIPTIE